MSSEVSDVGEVVLRTKLHPPRAPADLVGRPHLLDRLEAERTRPLALVSAPAGYGKSVLVASWLERGDWPSAWLSLDEDDGHLHRFLTYLVAAVRTAYPEACEQTLGLLHAGDLPGGQTVATVLANELDGLERPLVLVLDDYHRIEAPSPVHELLERLLLHPPIPLHLVLLTRVDPPLSLDRLRARSQVSEIRMQDLRFDAGETRALLENALGTTASEEGLASLDRELEGWVVGLRLVALALRYSPDPDELLRGFQGGTREIQEYLVNEVIARLAPTPRDWLTKSALLDRFCAPLCDAVCAESGDSGEGSFDGAAFLRAAQDANLFLIPLDAKGEWFRFHHLFQEQLRRELERQWSPEKIHGLHLRASRWLEGHGLVEESIRHALAAADPGAAAEIVERHRLGQLNADNWYVVERWLEMLPPVREERPDLLLAQAWIAYERFQIWALPALLERAAPLLDEEAMKAATGGELLFFQGAVAYWTGDGEASLRHFEDAEVLLSEDQPLFRGLLHLLGGLSLLMCGHPERAVETLREHVRAAGRERGIYFSRLVAGLFFTHLMSGDLGRARAEAVRLESVASTSDIHYTRVWSSYMQACAHLHRNELDLAARHFADVAEQRFILHRAAAADGLVGLALSQELLGRGEAATETLELLSAFAREVNDPACLAVAESARARLGCLRGEGVGSGRWAGSIADPPESAELFMWLEVPCLTRARVWIAAGTAEGLERANALLEEVSRRSQAWHFTNQVIEAGALRSRALEKLGRNDEALACLAAAVGQAAPGGWVRPFLEAGPPMAELLGRLRRQGETSDFSRHLLDVLRERPTPPAGPVATRARVVVSNSVGIRETLTNREIDLLELLAQRLQNKEIAARLFVSPETVKSHLKRLFQKLGVHNRREAATVAAELIAAAGGSLPSR